MKRTLLNLKYIAKQATKWTGGVFSLLGLASTFVSLNDILDDNMSFWCRLLISVSILAGVWVGTFICCAIYLRYKRRIEILEVNSGHHVYVQYGDIFSEDEVLEPDKRRNIVIPVNRCFDTLIDDDLISSTSLHGIAMRKIYGYGVYDRSSLNEQIQVSLSQQESQTESLDRQGKRKGNLCRYPIGCVSEIQVSPQCTFFFLGLTTLDKDLKASVTDDDYVVALMKLLEFCNRRSQGFPVVLPLIGGGLSRTAKDERDILEYIVKLIKLNRNLVNSDIHIVVRENGKGSIAITDI